MNYNANTEALSVTEVNKYIKMLIAGDDILSAVAIRGEISNFKRHPSGHLYFTLKDEGAEIAAVMFRGDTGRLQFSPVNGMRVVVFGNIDVYERSGRYQIYVRSMLSDGAGAMAEAYERLKRKLEAEGLFAEELKRPIPRFPKCIGVITAPTGAAIRDILNITGRRYPQAKVLVCPALVQGIDAPASLRNALELITAYGECDVIIIGRGGGSVEDLWAFNDEMLARAVAACPVPIISAVGHETDFTLCDFVADRRAPTPSAAAEIATPDILAVRSYVADTEGRILRNTEKRIEAKRQRVEQLSGLLAARSPEARLANIREKIERKKENMDRIIESRYAERLARCGALIEKLNALNPLAVLQRGYSAVMDKDGSVVASTSQLSKGQEVILTMSDGRAEAEIISVEKNKLYGEK